MLKRCSQFNRDALDTDEIEHGGSDDLRNPQALCFRCNAGKRDTDSTDFRGLQASYALRQAGCVFCALEGSGRPRHQQIRRCG